MNAPVEWLEDRFDSTYVELMSISKNLKRSAYPTWDEVTTEYTTCFQPIRHIDWSGPTALFTIKEDT